jgi:pantothenate synthetase
VHALEGWPVLVALAAQVGAARLIDNVLIQPTEPHVNEPHTNT